MWRDPIVEEIHKFRQEYAARFNYDLKAICEDLRKRQAASGRKVVSLPPRRVSEESTVIDGSATEQTDAAEP